MFFASSSSDGAIEHRTMGASVLAANRSLVEAATAKEDPLIGDTFDPVIDD